MGIPDGTWMLLQQLRLFATVAREGSILSAAARLRIAQPALSRQIRRLEDEVGVALFERQRRGVRLTPPGAALLAGSDELFARLDEALRRTRDTHAGTNGTVKIALGRMALENARVGEAIAAVRARLPRVRVDVVEIPSLDQLQALRACDADIAIGMADFANAAEVESEILFEEVVDCAMVSLAHPLARQAAVDVAQLRKLPYLTVRTTPLGGFPAITSALAKAGITPAETFDSVESVWGFVAAGRGWGLASRTSLAHPPAGTAVVRIADFHLEAAMYARWRASDRSRVLRNVLQLLRAAVHGTAVADDIEREPTPPRVSRPHGASTSSADMATLELEHLKALVAATGEGSLSRAAHRLQLTQSGVSRRIKALEREVGCRLVERGASGVTATSEGAVLRCEAVEVLLCAERALARARQAAAGISGRCRLGTLPAELTNGFQESALRQAMEAAPEIHVELTEMLPERQVQALRERHIDIGIGGGFPGMPLDPTIAAVRLMEDPMECALISRAHPLALRSWITAQELQAMPFVFIGRDNGWRMSDAVMKALAAIGVTPGSAPAHGGLRAVWRAVAAGHGWTVGTRSQRAHPPAGLVAIPVAGLEVPWGLVLFWRADESDAAVLRVLDAFRTIRGHPAFSRGGGRAIAAAPDG